MKNNHHKKPNGNALLLAIIVTMLLFIIGMAFLSSTITEKTSISYLEQQATLNNAVDKVIEQINNVLVRDLLGGDGKLLNGDSSDEPYDYPGAADPWLASLEPEFIPTGTNVVSQNYPDHYYWPHITELWGSFGSQTFPDATYICYYDPDEYHPSDPDQLRSDGSIDRDLYRTSAFHVPVRIIKEDEVIESTILNKMSNPPWASWPPSQQQPASHSDNGMRADADGDGVTDSRWVQLGRTGPEGKYIYAAVRIIDNSGMLNVNTAYKDPRTLTPPEPWDGSKLTDINLEAIARGSDTPEFIHGYRCNLGWGNWGNLAAPASMYNADVSLRVQNPQLPGITWNPGYIPYDFIDELELRNRFFINNTSKTKAITEIIWPATFDPVAVSYYKWYPYYDSDLTNLITIGNWFEKANYDFLHGFTNYYALRHICTTYNFDRITRPGGAASLTSINDMDDTPGQRKVRIKLPTGGPFSGFPDGTTRRNYIKQLAGAIYRGLPDNAKIKDRFGDKYTRENLARHYAVNLIDAQDSGNNPIWQMSGGIRYFGVEDLSGLKEDTLQISKIGYVDFSGGVPPAGKYFAIEVFNPDDTAGKASLGDYELRVIDSSQSLKGTISLTDSISASSGTGSGDTVVFVFTNSASLDPVTDATTAFGSDINSSGNIEEGTLSSSFDLDDEDKIIVIKRSNSMPVDCVMVPVGMISNAITNNPEVIDRSQTLPGTNFLLPAAYNTSVFDPWSSPSSNDLGDDINPSVDLRAVNTSTHLIEFEGIDKVPIPVSGQSLISIGEIENVLAVGFRYGISSGKIECQTLWQGLVDSVVAIKKLDTTPDNTADMELNIQMGTFGRVKLNDPDYWGLFDFLTYFDPSNDVDSLGIWVDNDGNIMTSNDPTTDSVNQDGDSNPGPDADENQPQWYEQTVAGRININTAPWFVIQQLPWLGLKTDGITDTNVLAQAIVAWRDKLDLSSIPVALGGPGPNYKDNPATPPPAPQGREFATGISNTPTVKISENKGFRDVAELLQVINTDSATDPVKKEFDIRKYLDGVNIPYSAAPTYSTNDFSNDTITDDLEERNIIFHRVSNLVTVRSDVFTAYILVRLGRDGPQKRMLAIFDRSNVFNSNQTPKLIALHPVPDPR